jgi:hypothetical protein
MYLSRQSQHCSCNIAAAQTCKTAAAVACANPKTLTRNVGNGNSNYLLYDLLVIDIARRPLEAAQPKTGIK